MSFESITTGSPILDGVIITCIIGVPTLLYRFRKKIFVKKTKFYGRNITQRKSYGDKKHEQKEPSFESNMKALRGLARIFNPQPIRHNKEFGCGCWAKDTDMVKLCKMHKQQYLFGINYKPQDGYYVSEDHSLG